MLHDSPSAELRTADEALHAIDDLLQEVARLSKSEMTPHEFHTELLDRAVAALAAVGGVVWIRDAQGGIQADCQVHLGATRFADVPGDEQRHRELLNLILRTETPRVVPPYSAADGDGSGANPTEFVLLLSPLIVDHIPFGVIEVVQRPGTTLAAQQGYLRFLSALNELAADFHRQRQLRELREHASLWGQFEQFTERIHAQLDVPATAYTLANEGRTLLATDRVSVGVVRGKKVRLLAVSGVDRLDRRSNLVSRLERLATAVVRTGETFWHVDDESEPADILPPQLDEPLNQYLAESRSRFLAVVPLFDADTVSKTERRRVIGVLVIERFDADYASGLLRQRVGVVSRHGELALRHALAHHNVALRPVLRVLNSVLWIVLPRQLPKTLFALIVLSAGMAALVLVPADFDIEGRGELQPVRRREVFAGSDGVINEVRVEYGDRVAAGDVLVRLRKSQLDFEFSRVLGEMQTARKRLTSIQASRLATIAEGNDARKGYNQLTAEEEELKELLASLEKQYAILKSQQEELTVRSPLDGSVLTWKIVQLLESRPVQRGQGLLTVADLNGPWVLEMHVPDDQVGHVLAAQHDGSSTLDVSFVLATDPALTHHGRIENVAMSVETDEKNGPEALVTVSIDPKAIPGLRPGASVVPKIHCGRRSLGYVWLHRLWETIQKRLLF